MTKPFVGQYYRVGRVAEYFGIGVSSVWNRAKNDPKFPKPFRIGARTTVWAKSDLDAYAEAMKAQGAA